MFVNHVLVSKILKLTILSNQTVFFTLLFSQNKNFNILKINRAFKVKQKAFLVIFLGLSISKNCLRSESALSNGSKLYLNKRHCLKSIYVFILCFEKHKPVEIFDKYIMWLVFIHYKQQIHRFFKFLIWDVESKNQLVS